MNFADAPFFNILRAQLSVLGQRERLTAENIANASTPGYQPRDLDTSQFQRALDKVVDSGGVVRHALTARARTVESPDSETTIDGNSVVVEEQMARAADTRMAYETSLALYQKGLDLMRLAIKSPNR